MEAYLEVTIDEAFTLMSCISNVLIEEIDDTISIHAQNGFMMTIKKADIIEENCSDERCEYRLDNKLNIIIDFHV